jgi:glycosyltransferase EpsD
MNFSNIIVYRQIKELINNHDYSLIHCHTAIGGVIARLAAKKKRKTGTRVIYSAHGFHFYKGSPLKYWLLYYPVERRLSRYTDALITLNNEDFLLAMRNMRAKKTYYMPGVGIETKKFSQTDADRDSKRRELSIPADATVIISIGELSKRKNHRAALKALGKIKSDNWYYIICGIGDLNEYLVKLCQKLGIDKRVLFLGYRTDTAELLHIADIFLFPSLQEGLPVALMEAMAAGLPCVASRIRGNVDLLEADKGGFLCGAKDIDEYSRALDELLKNSELRKDLGEYNKNAVQSFDLATVMEKTKEIYSTV